MALPTVYNYHKVSYHYTVTSQAPADALFPGNYLQPAFSTVDAPVIPSGQTAFFINDEWVYRTSPAGGDRETFFYLAAPGVHRYVGEPFTVGSREYTSNEATELLFIYLGYTRVEVQTKPTVPPQDFTVTGPNDDGSWTVSDNRILSVYIDRAQQDNFAGTINLLDSTNWILIKNALESGPAVPAAVTTYRQNLRSIGNSRHQAFAAVTSLAAYDALIASIDTDYPWPVRPTLPDF